MQTQVASIQVCPEASSQRGTTVTETVLVLLLVVVISSGALMALQGPIARLYRMQSTWYSMPFP